MKSGHRRRGVLAIFISAFSFLLATLVAASAATVTFTLSDFTSSPATNRAVLIRPLAFTVPTNQVAAYDVRMFRSDTNGQLVVSNMLAGTYQVDLQAPPSLTTCRIVVPTNGATWAAGSLVVVATNAVTAPQSLAWSTTASDARYQLTGANVLVASNVAFAAVAGYATNAGGLTFSALVTNLQVYGLTVWDEDGFQTLDLDARALVDATGGHQALNWGARQLKDTGGNTVLDWSAGLSGDGAGLTNLNAAQLAAPGGGVTTNLSLGGHTWCITNGVVVRVY